jgi:starch-binding outer membrane protein, SusD/RagB family
MRWIKCFLVVNIFNVLVSCKKLIEVPSPVNALTSDNVYTSDATAASVLSGIYSLISTPPIKTGSTINSISLITGLSGDEFNLYGGPTNNNTALVLYYQNKLSSVSTQQTASLWNDLYAKVYTVNLAIERLVNSSLISAEVKSQLIGEAKFLRAFFFFYLTNLYGDVPLVLGSDYKTNSILSRSSQAIVYDQIISDLKDAQQFLKADYVGSNGMTISSERLRPNKSTASALLARVYLYVNDWEKAESEASQLIVNPTYKLSSLNDVFLKNSLETIWQLQPVNIGWNTEDAKLFVLPATGPSTSSLGNPVYLNQQLINSFESNDLRKMNWIGSVTLPTSSGNVTYYFPYKYKNATLNAPSTEYLTVFRLSEQYLIRSEARANRDNINGAKSDLDMIRSRAGLPGTSAYDKATMISAILQERRAELFTEWGHRWLDLKRTGKINEVMMAVAPEKSTTWNSNWQLYPIPSYEIIQNPNLIQNNGY